MIGRDAIERRGNEVLQQRIVLINSSHCRRGSGGDTTARGGGAAGREAERERGGPEGTGMGFTKMFGEKSEIRVGRFF